MDRRTFLAGTAAAAALAPTMAVAEGTASAPTLLVAGQSLAMPWAQHSVQQAFCEAIGAEWSFLVVGRSGSSACPVKPGNWWIDGKTAGPVLHEAVAKVRASELRPTAMLWSQGQSDGMAYDGGDPEEFVTSYVAAVLNITRRLRRAVAEDWRSIPCMIQTIGWARHPETGQLWDPHGFPLIRHAQARLLAYHGNTHNLVPGAVQSPWLPLGDWLHPNAQGNRIMARMTAKAVMQWSA